jgi:hypothetical protein
MASRLTRLKEPDPSAFNWRIGFRESLKKASRLTVESLRPQWLLEQVPSPGSVSASFDAVGTLFFNSQDCVFHGFGYPKFNDGLSRYLDFLLSLRIKTNPGFSLLL